MIAVTYVRRVGHVLHKVTVLMMIPSTQWTMSYILLNVFHGRDEVLFRVEEKLNHFVKHLICVKVRYANSCENPYIAFSASSLKDCLFVYRCTCYMIIF